MRYIKRYGNRKLYDTHESRYIRQDDLYRLFHEGEEIKVVNQHGNDITASVMLQALAVEEKINPRLSVSEVREMVRKRENIKPVLNVVSAGQG